MAHPRWNLETRYQTLVSPRLSNGSLRSVFRSNCGRKLSDRPEPYALQEILRRMKGEPEAVLQMIAVEDQIMSLKTARRFFDNAMLTARHYRKKCARAILNGRYSLKQLAFIKSERQSRVSSLEAHRELTFSATSYAQLCLDQFKHSWKGWEQIVLPPPSSRLHRE